MSGCFSTAKMTSQPQQLSDATIGALRVHMITAKDGWGLNRDSVVRTTDGGRFWFDVTPAGPDGHAHVLPPLRAFFSGKDDAWVAGSSGAGDVVAYYTTDGGRTWQKTPVATARAKGQLRVAALTFADARHGWLLLTLGTNLNPGDQSATLYGTTDGGHTWALVADSKIPIPGPIGGISFRDAQTGWLAEHSTNATRYVFLYVTHNGGRSWHHQTLPLPMHMESMALGASPPSFFSRLEGVLKVSALGVLEGSDEHVVIIYHTRDGGSTWHASTPLRGLAVDMSDTSFFLDPNHGWISDGDEVVATVDGGVTWQVMANKLNAMGGVIRLDFVTANDGWGSFGAGLFKTTTAGRSWVQP